MLPNQIFELNFHLSSEVSANIIEEIDGAALLTSGSNHLFVEYFAPDGVELQITETWRSSGYGIKMPGPTLKTLIYPKHENFQIVCLCPILTSDRDVSINLGYQAAVHTIMNFKEIGYFNQLNINRNISDYK
jgi:hypothetical protein